LNTNGSISASVAAPPIPGSRPTTKPSAMPTSIRLNAFHCSTSNKPSTSAWIIQ
jgi:hypothetical protein